MMSYPHWWNETLTLYRRVNTPDSFGKSHISWTREVLTDCFVGDEDRQYFDGNAVISQPVTILRIPAKYNAPNKGDRALIGDVSVLDPATEPCIIINAVKQNDKLRQPHWWCSNG